MGFFSYSSSLDFLIGVWGHSNFPVLEFLIRRERIGKLAKRRPWVFEADVGDYFSSVLYVITWNNMHLEG